MEYIYNETMLYINKYIYCTPVGSSRLGQVASAIRVAKMLSEKVGFQTTKEDWE